MMAETECVERQGGLLTINCYEARNNCFRGSVYHPPGDQLSQTSLALSISLDIITKCIKKKRFAKLASRSEHLSGGFTTRHCS